VAAYEVLLLNTAIPQIQAAQTGDTYVVPRDIAINATAIISANSATNALRITQTGAGNALVVEDSANPDSSPFVVTAAGDVGIGTNAPATKLDVSGTARVNSVIAADGANGTVQFGSTSTYNITGGVDNGGFRFNLPSGVDYQFRISGSDVMRLTSSGNLGLGVTPSAWDTFTGFQVGGLGAASIGGLSNNVFFASNAYYGSGQFRYAAAASTVATIYRQTAGQHIWINAAAGTAGNVITPIQAMTLDASGRLLVGTTGVFGSIASMAGGNTVTNGYGQLSLVSTDALAIDKGGQISFSGVINNVGGQNWLAAVAGRKENATSGNYAGYLQLTTCDSGGTMYERARITSGGDLLVNTQTRRGSARQTIYQNSLFITGDGLAIEDGNATTGGAFIGFFDESGTKIGSVSRNAAATVAYNTSSDYRLKDNPQPLTNSGAFIDALKPKTWDWKADGSKGVGFIAHEVQEVSPGTVLGAKDAVDADGKPVMQAMEYGSAEFIANIIAELQSLRARVAKLESK